MLSVYVLDNSCHAARISLSLFLPSLWNWSSWGYHLGFEDSKDRGLELGLQQVSLGELASIQVPAPLAYGAQGCDEKQIPPHADLVYKVDILDVESELELAF